jgi:hypothetical protein
MKELLSIRLVSHLMLLVIFLGVLEFGMDMLMMRLVRSDLNPNSRLLLLTSYTG